MLHSAVTVNHCDVTMFHCDDIVLHCDFRMLHSVVTLLHCDGTVLHCGVTSSNVLKEYSPLVSQFYCGVTVLSVVSKCATAVALCPTDV